MEHLFDNDVLEELAASFIANGYFSNEPILVLPADNDGRRIVVEGNRRLSTLMILTQVPAAKAAGLQFDLSIDPSSDELEQLSAVPAYEVQSREELGAYLGYRHIGGIREWPAESKARWIHQTVNDAVATGENSPFYRVGRTIGSNARGVRTAYLTAELLRIARDEYDIDTESVERDRFSVWGLLISNSRIRKFIGLGNVLGELPELQRSLEAVDYERVAAIIDDLTPSARKLPLLSDSRMVSRYAEVVVNDRAREILRRFDDLELAMSVLEQGALADRIRAQAMVLKEILVDASRVRVDSETHSAADELSHVAQSIFAVVRDRTDHG